MPRSDEIEWEAKRPEDDPGPQLSRFRPNGDRLLVRVESQDGKLRESGLFVPASAKETPHVGVVVKLGRGRRDEKGNRVPIDDVEEGDTVVYSRYGGVDVELDGDRFLILRETDVLGVLPKEKK